MSTIDPAGARPDASKRGYNLFRNRERPELFCAVPEDRPVPGFIFSGEWLFDRPLLPVDVPPPGFHLRAAAAGVRFNGYYLFQRLRSG